MGSGISSKSKNLANQVIDITYADLVTLIGNSELTLMAKYRITDFATVHYMLDGDGDVCVDSESDPVINTGTTEPLIVCAVSTNQLDKIAVSETYPQDIIYYDWDGDNWLLDLAFGKTDSTLVTGFKGVIYERHDTKNNNKVGYDFRNVKSRRWEKDYAAWSDATEYSQGDIVSTALGAYISLQGTNTNHLTTDTAWWAKIIDYSLSKYWEYSLSSAKDAEDYDDCLLFEPKGTDTYEIAVIHNEFARKMVNNTLLPNTVIYLASEDGDTVTFNRIAYMSCNTFGAITQGNVCNGLIYNSIFNEFAYNTATGGAYIYDNIIYSMKHCHLSKDFNDAIVLDGFENNTVSANVNVLDFSTATHVYEDYDCNIFTDSLGATKLSYIDGTTGALTVVDATA